MYEVYDCPELSKTAEMRIAVIGGSLLGCATALDLALIQEYDEGKASDRTQKFELTLFEKADRLGGNDFKSVKLDDGVHVEVGRYRTLPLTRGSFLHDLVDAANDGLGTFSLFGKRYAIPGATVSRRGRVNAAEVTRPWSRGTYKRLVRTFALWDWKDDVYQMKHSGWSALDLLYRILDNNIWTTIALAGFVYSVDILLRSSGRLQRALVLGQCVTMLVIVLLSPKKVVEHWQNHFSFWSTTVPLLINYGITPAISRGSAIGFLRQVSEANTRNAATCAISVGSLMKKTGLEEYVRGSADDYVRKFKYQSSFVARYMEPMMAWTYEGSRMTELNSLVSQYAMLDGDFSNTDAGERLSHISPNNAVLCDALVEAAQSTLELTVKLNSAVTAIVYNDEKEVYEVTYGNNEKAEFEGIALCASPMDGDMVIETPVGTSVAELLGYNRDREAKEIYEEQEMQYRAESEGVQEEAREAALLPAACTHVAVVVGRAKASFFRVRSEKEIADLVHVTNAPNFARFERIQESSLESGGAYSIVCGRDFESSGLFSEMFEEGAEIKHFEAVAKNKYSYGAIPLTKAIDECVPRMVLGSRFIYVAATRKLALHPELDAMSAVNGASLFSRAVQWTTGEEEEGEAEEE